MVKNVFRFAFLFRINNEALFLFSGSADSGIAEQEQPSVSPESRVLQEVLETETVYVEDLNEVIEVSRYLFYKINTFLQHILCSSFFY